MFRTFRRIYFKIYHLLRFLGIFLLVFFPSFVSADCTNIFEGKTPTVTEGSYSSWRFIQLEYTNIPVSSQTPFTLSFTSNTDSIYNYLSSSSIINGTNFYLNFGYNASSRGVSGSTYTNSYYTYNYSYNYSSITVYIRYDVPSSLYTSTLKDTLASLPYFVNVGSTACTPTPEPEPEPDSDSTFSSFIILYLDRFTYLATNFTSNPYLLAFLGVIFSFIVLELFLHILHIKGGYKK